MPRNRRSFSRSKAQYSWFAVQGTPTTVAAGAEAVLDLRTIDVPAGVRNNQSTIVRMIGYIEVRATAVGFDAAYAAGIIVVHEDSFTALALPDPLTEGAQPWLWYHQGHEISFAADSLARGQREEYDIKSKRRYNPETQVLLFIIENALSSGMAINITTGWRYLMRT